MYEAGNDWWPGVKEAVTSMQRELEVLRTRAADVRLRAEHEDRVTTFLLLQQHAEAADAIRQRDEA